MKYVLSIDQGTTSSRAIVFDENQKIIAESQREYELQYPNDGWVEANPDEILSSVKETIKEHWKELMLILPLAESRTKEKQ